MLTLMDKAAVIKLHNEGNSNRQIAKLLSISRTTVNKYLAQYEKDKDELSKATDPIEISIIQERMLCMHKRFPA